MQEPNCLQLFPRLENGQRSLVLLFHSMKKFNAEEAHGGAPGYARLPWQDELCELVRFAMRQGYYDAWNKPADQPVKPCAGVAFPTDRGPVSG